MWRYWRGRWRAPIYNMGRYGWLAEVDCPEGRNLAEALRVFLAQVKDSGEDVELYAAELGITREAAHRA